MHVVTSHNYVTIITSEVGSGYKPQYTQCHDVLSARFAKYNLKNLLHVHQHEVGQHLCNINFMMTTSLQH